jgi:ABC-type oligopeptide transport system substrate-binding subunit
LGITVDWQEIPWSSYFELMQDEEYHILYVAWPAYYPDPDSFLRVALSSITNWRYEPYEELINQARHSLDNSYRLQLFRKAEEILAEQAPILPLLYINDHILIKPWIKKFQTQTISRPFWHHVIIEPH